MTRQDLEQALLAGATSEELLARVEALQEAGQTFGELEAWLYGLAASTLPHEALVRLQTFIDEELDTAAELTADGVRYWTFLHHSHAEELGFGVSVSLKAIERPGHGLFLFCSPGDFPELELHRVDGRHVFLGTADRPKLGAAELAALRSWHQQVPLFEETGSRRLIDRLTSALRKAPMSAYSVARVGASPDTWRLSIGGRWREVAIRAAEGLARPDDGGSLRRL